MLHYIMPSPAHLSVWYWKSGWLKSPTGLATTPGNSVSWLLFHHSGVYKHEHAKRVKITAAADQGNGRNHARSHNQQEKQCRVASERSCAELPSRSAGISDHLGCGGANELLYESRSRGGSWYASAQGTAEHMATAISSNRE